MTLNVPLPINVVCLSLDAAPWDVPLTLYDDLDDVLNFNNSITLSTCKKHIISNQCITKINHGFVTRFVTLYVKETAVLNVLKELYLPRIN